MNDSTLQILDVNPIDHDAMPDGPEVEAAILAALEALTSGGPEAAVHVLSAKVNRR